MAVYEANTRSLAEFISDTKLGFMPSKVKSTTGYRGVNSTYMISAHEIHCERIYVVNDCFIDIEGNITVTSYIPSIKYFLISNELSSYYQKGTHLSFEFLSHSKVLRYEIGKDMELKTYEDFNNYLNSLIKHIEQNIEDMINDFNGCTKIDNVVCDIEWQIDKIKVK